MSVPASHLDPEALVGQELGGQYTVGKIVGAGGMAVVYEAQRRDPPRRVAIKVILPEAIKSDGTTVERFRREAAIAKRLQNPHMVEFLDYGKLADGRPYLVMEYLEGEDLLNRLLLNGPLSLPQAVEILAGVCSALATAHAMAIIHRDLKPSNIYLAKAADGGKEVVKLLDFGASKLERRSLSELTSRGVVIGTAEYMSPEQARGAALDSRSDIFSLGIMLFEMLTGKRPFEAARQIDVLFLIVGAPQPSARALVPALPESVDTVLAKMMAKKVDDRYQEVGELMEALRRLVPGASTEAPPMVAPSAPERPTTGERRKRLKQRTGLASAVLADDRSREDRLAEPLITLGLVTAGAVEEARRDQTQRGGELAEALLRTQAISDVVLLRTFATRYGARYVRADKVERLHPPPELLVKVPYALARKLMVLPFNWAPPHGDVQVLAAVPVEPGVDAAIRAATGAAEVRLVLTTPSVLEDALRRCYPSQAPPKPESEEYVPPSAAEKKKGRISRSKQKAVEVPLPESAPPPAPEPLPAAPPPPAPPLMARQPSLAGFPQVVPSTRPPSVGVPAARPPSGTGGARPPSVTAARAVDAAVAAGPAMAQLAKATFSILDEILSADRCAVVLESGQALLQHPAHAGPETVPPSILSQAKGMSGGLLIGDAADDYRFQSAGGALVQGLRTVMCVPLRREATAVGVLFAGSTRGNPFRAGDLQRLLLLADQLSLGLGLALSGGARPVAEPTPVPAAPAPTTSDAAVLWVEVPELALVAAQRPAAQVLKAVNQLFEDVAAAIEASRGRVDRHLGHGVVGCFTGERAVLDAIDAGRKALSCGAAFTLSGKPVVLRIGVHVGLVVAGRVGLGRRFVESSVGPALYVASRLGSLEPGRIVLSEQALDRTQLNRETEVEALPSLELELDTHITAWSVVVKDAGKAAFTVELG